MAPAGLIDLSVRPTKIDRASDVRGLVDTGKLANLLDVSDTVAVLEAIQRVSARKMLKVDPKQPWLDPESGVSRNEVVRELVQCGYLKAADVVDRYGDPAQLDPDLDPDIVGSAGIFSQAEYDGDGEFRKTAAVMKMVIYGYAGAGTIEMGGYDYHGQGRSTGEVRDFRAGRCMGACLEYAARRGRAADAVRVLRRFAVRGRAGGQHRRRPRQVHVERATTSRRRPRSSSCTTRTGGRRCSVRAPAGRRAAPADRLFPAGRVGRDRVEPGGQRVNLLVETVVLNYMALHGEHGQFSARFPGHGLGSAALQDSLIAFNPIVSGTIT